MPAKPRRARLGTSFARLEDRTVPALFGIPWPDAHTLTLSFPADGVTTPVGANTTAGMPADWKRETLRAFQTWAVQTNANIGVVADGGQPLGSRGAVQGDKRFGDIRVGVAPIDDPDELAFASPFTWTGTTFAGDVLFDSTHTFATGSGSGIDVFTVAAHEAGHVFGLDHSTEPGSVLTPTYSKKTGLTAGDVAAVRGIYGARTADAYDRANTGNTLSTAVSLPAVAGTNNQFSATADLTTAGDVDYFKVTVPLGLSAASLRLKAAGSSLLTAKLSLYTSLGVPVGTWSASDPLNNDISVRTALALPGTYIVKVEGASADVFGQGGYQLTVDLTPTLSSLLPALPVVGPLLDAGNNDSPNDATQLSQKTTTDSRFDAFVYASVEAATDTDVYKLRPAAGLTGQVGLNLLVWGAETNPVWPSVRVFNDQMQPVAHQVLANDDGSLSVWVGGLPANKDVYLQVTARAPGSVGGYYLGADFNTFTAPDLAGLSTGVLTAGAAPTVGEVTVHQTGLYLVGVGGTLTGNTTGTAGVQFELLDAGGATLVGLTAAVGKAGLTRSLFLSAGTYTVRYKNTAAAGGPGVRYQLVGHRLTDPIGPDEPDLGGTTSPPPPPRPMTSGSSDTEPTGLPPVY